MGLVGGWDCLGLGLESRMLALEEFGEVEFCGNVGVRLLWIMWWLSLGESVGVRV